MKMFKCFFLLFCLTASLYAADWDGSMSQPENMKKIDGKGFYLITNAKELAWFADQVNNKGNDSINAMLVNDVNVFVSYGSYWTPIGVADTAIFNGIFDGAGWTISGLRTAGLFGVIGETAVVKNVTVVGTISGKVAGGIVAYNRGTVISCTNSAFVSSSDGGGIVGKNEGTVSYCMNSDSIVAKGGIVGENYGTVSYCTNSGSIKGRGGIVGENYGTVSYCTNSGSIDGEFVGGIVARNEGTVSYCTNSGSIDGEFVGGIVAWNEDDGMVSYCTNSGSISVTELNYSGGIVGLNEGSVRVCTNSGEFSPYIDAYTSKGNGSIVGRNKGMVADCRNLVWNAAWGVVGRMDVSSATMINSFNVTKRGFAGIVNSCSGLLFNCYYDFDVLTGLSADFPNIGMHTSEMQSDSFAWILNTTNGTMTNSEIWSRDSVGYPIFADSLHKPIYNVIFDDSEETTSLFTNYKGLISLPKDPEPPEGKKFFGWYTDDGIEVETTTVFSKDEIVTAIYDSTQIPHGDSSSEKNETLTMNIPVPTWSITASGRNFQIRVAPVGKPYALFDLQGKVLAKGRIENSEMTLSAPRAGSYIVRIGERSVRVNAR